MDIDVEPDGSPTTTLEWEDLVGIEIAGPGKVSSGGGFIGGGLGDAQHIASGMAIGGVLNAITARSKVQTFFGLLFADRELWLLHVELEPVLLRIELASVFTRMRIAQSTR